MIRAAAAAAPIGLLETVWCGDGSAPLLELHQRRLAASWPAFFRGRPPALARVAADAIAATSGGRALVRIAFLKKPRGRVVTEVESRPFAPLPVRISVAIAAAARRGPAPARCHKSADRAWVDEHAVAGAFETLVWDDEHGLLEGTRSNLFAISGRELATPPAEFGLVPGVVRARVRRIAPRLGLKVRERPIAPADLRGDGLLLTGSGLGIVAVAECDGRSVASRAATELASRLAQVAFRPE